MSKSEASLGTAKKDAEVELYSSLNRLNNYEELIPIQQEILLSAEEDLKLAEQKYELGSADILELLDAQLAVIQASSSLVTTKLAFINDGDAGSINLPNECDAKEPEGVLVDNTYSPGITKLSPSLSISYSITSLVG